MEGVHVENFVPFTSNLHSVAFVNVKFHLPGEFPLGYRIKISLQKDGITREDKMGGGRIATLRKQLSAIFLAENVGSSYVWIL